MPAMQVLLIFYPLLSFYFWIPKIAFAIVLYVTSLMNLTKGGTKMKSNCTRRNFLKLSGIAGASLLFPLNTNVARAAEKSQLNVYSWYTQLIKEYMALYSKETGTETNLIGSYGGNPIWWTKMMAGETWDFFIPSMDWLQRAAKAGMIEPLDITKIPNYENLSEEGKRITKEQLSFDGRIYAIPFTLVINALVWNTTKVSPTPASWSALWDKQYKDRISMKDEPQLTIMVAALYTGQNPNNIKDWDSIKKALLAQRELVKKYWNTHDEIFEMLATEQVWLSQYNDGRIRELISKKIPLNYTVPKEGAPSTIDCLAIPKSAKNKEEAHRFINFILKPENIALQMKSYNYLSFVPAAEKFVSDELKKSHQIPQDWYGRLVWRSFTPPETQKQMDSVWMEVKMK
jgi:spermidine/putrescine transport system substrate-binding protein